MAVVAPARADVDRAAMIQLSSSIVKIEAATRTGYGLGSGVIVGPEKVATNCHVTRRAIGIFVLERGIRLPVSEQAVNALHDVCVLRVPGLAGHSVETADAAEIRRGEPLVAVGFSGGLELSFNEGELVSRYRVDNGMVLRSTTFFGSGASGGGLFDAKGRLLGILTFRLPGADDNYFSVPMTWIAEQARDDASFHPVAPIEGEAFWERASPAFRDLVPESAAQAMWQGAALAAPAAAAVETPKSVAPEASAASESASPISRAEQLLFLDPHLATIKPPQTLRYLMTDEDASHGRIEETATIELKADPQGQCCIARGSFPTVDGQSIDLPDVAEATANPVLLYFLERETRQLQARTKGQSAHFRRQIRMALADEATVGTATVRYKGSDVTATQISVKPFVNDQFRSRFEKEAATEYTFLLSPAVPGGVLMMRATLPGAQPVVRRMLLLEGTTPPAVPKT